MGGSAASPDARWAGPRILAGSARSGTTWLLDGLAESNGLRTSFEPLHAQAVPAAAPFAHHYVPPDADWPELEAFLGDVLSGRGTRLWSDLRVRPDRFFDAPSPARVPALAALRTRRMVRRWRHLRRVRRRPILCKLIRANLMLGWLAQRLSARTLLLVRHPGGVVASQLRTDPHYWQRPEDLLQGYLSEPALLETHLGPLTDFLSGPLEPVELRTALWCIENAIPVREAAAWNVTAVSYERLLLRDGEEWRRTLDALALSQRPDDASLERPSAVASKDFKSRPPAARGVERWMESLSDRDKARIDAVLDRFGVTAYRTDDPLPR